MSSYIYTFIRADISPEQKIVQIGHACFEAGKKFRDHDHISNLILLAANDENDLKLIERKLDEHGIEFYIFFEPDNDMGHSAICTKPIVDRKQRAIFKHWKLYSHSV